MARVPSVRVGKPKSVPKPGRPSNVNYDRSVVMRPPRLKLLSTREYGKPQPYPKYDQTSGFGQTGLTNES